MQLTPAIIPRLLCAAIAALLPVSVVTPAAMAAYAVP